MAHISEDRVLETSTTTGTGVLTLAGALTGYRTFASVMVTTDTCCYAVWGVNASGEPTGEWEAGVGTYSATNTLTRTTVLESSNAGSVVTLSAGTKYVALTLLGSKTGQFDDLGAMLIPLASAEPPTPASGNYLYTRTIADQTVMKYKRPSGVDSPIQDSVAFNRFVKYQGGPATITAIGGGALTAATVGTLVTITTGTNIRNALPRTQYATAATANSINSLYASSIGLANTALRGTISGEGGFRLVMRFGLGATTATNRFFAGLRDVVTVPANIDPFTSTTPGVIGIAANGATSANYRIVHTLTGTTPTTIDLGANFPYNNTDLIELVLFCRPYTSTAGNVGYRVRRYTTTGEPAFESSGTLSTNLPTGATVLTPVLWMVNVAASAVNFQVNQITLESDF